MMSRNILTPAGAQETPFFSPSLFTRDLSCKVIKQNVPMRACGWAGRRVGLKQKRYFAWGGTVINAVTLHIYPCTFSVGHRELLNDVKLWFVWAAVIWLGTAVLAPYCVFDNINGSTQELLNDIDHHFRINLKWDTTFYCPLKIFFYLKGQLATVVHLLITQTLVAFCSLVSSAFSRV